MKRMKRPMRQEISEVQCGLTEGKGTTNANFVMRKFIERCIEVQKDIFLCFVDYLKRLKKFDINTLCHT